MGDRMQLGARKPRKKTRLVMVMLAVAMIVGGFSWYF